MPIPKPKDDESQTDFMDRCMSDSMMNEEYPDHDKHYAICMDAWKEKKSFSGLTEKRSFNFNMEVRADKDAKLKGHAAVFNEYANINTWSGSFKERIMRGAFIDSIQVDDVRALFNHDPNYVLGRNKSGTLMLSEDEIGLAIEIDPPQTQFAKDLVHLIERGDISQMSFAFIVLKDSWERGEEKEPDKRDIIKVQLFDISPVTFPAYSGTDIALASRSKAFTYKVEPDANLYRTDLLMRKLKMLKRR